MKTNKCASSLGFGLLAIVLFLLHSAVASQAAFQLVDNFQQSTTGGLSGQRGWTASAGAQVKNDPEQTTNLVASFGAGAGSAYLPLSIAQGSTATLYFRVHSEEATSGVDWFAGMSDVAITGVGAFGDFETQLGVAGAQSLDKLKVRDGSSGNVDSAEFLPDTWYKIWVVIDNAADTYEVYMQGGSLPEQTQIDSDTTGNTLFTFRNSGAGPVTNDLIRFFALSSINHQTPMLLDDVYLAPGKDLTDPAPTLNTPPTVTLTDPTAGAVFTAGENIPMAADATDSDGTIARVEFFQGAALIGSDTNSPFAFTWTNVPAGFHSLTAKATDNQGGARVSAPVSITVEAATTNNFVLLDSFETLTLTNLNGQNGWAATNASVITDPTRSTNKLASFSGPLSAGSLSLLLPEGRTGTLFFRAYAVSDTTAVDLSAGLSDMSLAGPARPFSDFEAQVSVAGAQLLDRIRARDAAENRELDEFLPRTWYKIWIVADNAIDQYEVWMQGGALAEPTLLVWDEFGYTSFVFRNSGVAPVANDLVKFLVFASASHSGPMLIDDIYWDQLGKNISDPVGPLSVLPTVTITAPAGGAIFNAPTNITLAADASLQGGTISKVEFFAGTNLIGVDASAPFSVVWSNSPAGGHSLQAKATDTEGNSQLSAPVTIVVNPAPAQLRIVDIDANTASGNVTLAWDGPGTQFQVEKALVVTGPYNPIGAPQPARSFTDAGTLKTNNQAFYRVRQVSGQGADCQTATAGGGFVNTSFTNQTGSFTVTFDATPAAAPIDSVVGLSSGAKTAFSGFAVLVRFNPTGNIDARNAGAYAAASTIPYSANVKHRFRIVVDLAAHTYSAYVTPEGGAEQLIGENFAFRTEQNTVTNLDNWAVTVASTTGSTTVCNFQVQ